MTAYLAITHKGEPVIRTIGRTREEVMMYAADHFGGAAMLFERKQAGLGLTEGRKTLRRIK